MTNDNDDYTNAMLEGAFLAQEEYDQNKNKWTGRRQDMEDHFLSTYDTLPVTSEPHPGGSHASTESPALLILLFSIFVIFACGLFLLMTLLGG